MLLRVPSPTLHPFEFPRRRIDPVEEAGMDQYVPQPSPLRVRHDIGKLIPKIQKIPNPMFVKPGLPYLAPKLLPQFMRKPALDALRATLDGLAKSRGQQDV